MDEVGRNNSVFMSDDTDYKIKDQKTIRLKNLILAKESRIFLN